MSTVILSDGQICKSACSLILVFIVTLTGKPAAAADPPSAKEVEELMASRSLTAETWPQWRDYYVRLYYAYNVGEPLEFYEQISNYLGATASASDNQLPDLLADDPVAWIAYANHLAHINPAMIDRAVAACRKAVSLGDPDGISSSGLADALISKVRIQNLPGELTPDGELALSEAEERLQTVAQVAPQARLSFARGLIAWQRGDARAALPLLRQGAIDHPLRSSYANSYLASWLTSDEATGPFAETTTPFLTLFPQDPVTQALHAVALYRDEQFLEAYQMLQSSRAADKNAAQFLGEEVLSAIEDGRWLTPPVIEGVNLAMSQSHASAISHFRNALEHDSQNQVAARLLARSLIALINSDHPVIRPDKLDETIDELAEICQRFHEDAELHVAHAAALCRADRYIEAESAIKRARAIEGDISSLLQPSDESMIRHEAQHQRNEGYLWLGLIGGITASATWLSVMYFLAVLLAMCTSRIPNADESSHDMRQFGDVWLERFYLLILGLSLLFFYISVPFVALGLLAMTFMLFVVMLTIRFIHIGILYRGLYATWGVIRSAFIGTSSDVLGIRATPEQHPELFDVLDEVARRLDTATVTEVYLSPSAAVGVREEGRGPFGLFRSRRVMEIGMATMSNLTTSEFKTILAHEFGHFTHQDPFYTRFISQVTASLATSLAVMDAAGGATNYVNPFYWFYWLYLRAYALLASGFSRSREFLADRRAVLAYDKESFISGLTKAAVEGAILEGTAVHNIQSALGDGNSFVNVFDALREYRKQPVVAEAHEEALKHLHETKPSWYDSHPTYSERVTAVERFPCPQEAPDLSPATNVLSGLEQVEEELTELLTHGIYEAMQASQLSAEC